MTPSTIDLTRLRDLLGEQAARFDVDVLAICESTNQVLAERAGRDAPAGSVVVADRQTAGRGRRGRGWESAQNDPEASLTFSVLWRFDAERPLAGLSLAVGIAIVRALEKSGLDRRRLGLKWPNDVLLEKAGSWCKLAGILIRIERSSRPSVLPGKNEVAAVIGIGLNRLIAPYRAEAAHLGAACLADALPAPPARQALLAAILVELLPVLTQFAQQGFAPFVDEWHRWHSWQDRSVVVSGDDAMPYRKGIARGVDAEGSLLIETDGRTERIWAGDLSLRVEG